MWFRNGVMTLLVYIIHFYVMMMMSELIHLLQVSVGPQLNKNIKY